MQGATINSINKDGFKFRLSNNIDFNDINLIRALQYSWSRIDYTLGRSEASDDKVVYGSNVPNADQAITSHVKDKLTNLDKNIIAIVTNTEATQPLSKAIKELNPQIVEFPLYR